MFCPNDVDSLPEFMSTNCPNWGDSCPPCPPRPVRLWLLSNKMWCTTVPVVPPGGGKILTTAFHAFSSGLSRFSFVGVDTYDRRKDRVRMSRWCIHQWPEQIHRWSSLGTSSRLPSELAIEATPIHVVLVGNCK